MYGLIGEKLSHSYSKLIHERIGEYDYALIPLSPDALEDFIKGAVVSGNQRDDPL